MVRTIGATVLIAAASVWLATQIYNQVLLRTDIYIIYSMKPEKTVYTPNEKPVLVYDFYRKRICKTDLLFVLWTDDAEKRNRAVWRSPTPGGGTEVGRTNPPISIPLPIPFELDEGCYKALTFTHMECAEGRHDFMDPPARFCVKKDASK